MEKSETIGNLTAALATFQGKLKPIFKDAENPYFKSMYATLGHILGEVRPILSEAGLAVSQTYDVVGDRLHLVTTLTHASGEWMQGRVALPSQGPIDGEKGRKGIAAAQDIGAATTYLRRFSLAAILGLEAEDDDGEGAMGRGDKPKAASKPPAPRPQTPAKAVGPDAPATDPNAATEPQKKALYKKLVDHPAKFDKKKIGEFVYHNNLTRDEASALFKMFEAGDFGAFEGFAWVPPAPAGLPSMNLGQWMNPPDEMDNEDRRKAWSLTMPMIASKGYTDWDKLVGAMGSAGVIQHDHQTPMTVSVEEFRAIYKYLKDLPF